MVACGIGKFIWLPYLCQRLLAHSIASREEHLLTCCSECLDGLNTSERYYEASHRPGQVALEIPGLPQLVLHWINDRQEL